MRNIKSRKIQSIILHFVATEMNLFVVLVSFEFLALEVPRSIFKKGAISNNFFYSLPSLSRIFNPELTFISQNFIYLFQMSAIHCSKLQCLSFQSLVRVESLPIPPIISDKLNPIFDNFWHSSLKYSMLSKSNLSLA